MHQSHPEVSVTGAGNPTKTHTSRRTLFCTTESGLTVVWQRNLTRASLPPHAPLDNTWGLPSKMMVPWRKKAYASRPFYPTRPLRIPNNCQGSANIRAGALHPHLCLHLALRRWRPGAASHADGQTPGLPRRATPGQEGMAVPDLASSHQGT